MENIKNMLLVLLLFFICSFAGAQERMTIETPYVQLNKSDKAYHLNTRQQAVKKEATPDVASRGEMPAAKYCKVYIDNWTGWYVDIYIDNKFVCSLAPWGFKCALKVSGKYRLTAKAMPQNIAWEHDFDCEYEYIWKLSSAMFTPPK